MSKTKKQSFMQGIMTLMFSQVIIKIFGLIYKLYLTNKKAPMNKKDLEMPEMQYIIVVFKYMHYC